MKGLLFGSIALALIAGPAIAADMPVKAAPAPVYSWTGLYFGINGGAAWGSFDTGLFASNGTPPFFFTGNIPGVNAAGAHSFTNSSWLAGAQIGYVYQNNSPLVFGFEVAFDGMDLHGAATNSQLYLSAVPNNGFTVSENVSTKWLLTFLARIGYDTGGGWVPYVTGGVAVADFKHSFNYIDTFFAPNCPCAASFSTVAGAPAIGAGLEWRVVHQWSFRAEFVYMNFSTFTTGNSKVGNLATGAIANLEHRAALQESIARALISYKLY